MVPPPGSFEYYFALNPYKVFGQNFFANFLQNFLRKKVKLF